MKKNYDSELDAEIGVWRVDDKDKKKWYPYNQKGIPAKIINSDSKDKGLDPPYPGVLNIKKKQ